MELKKIFRLPLALLFCLAAAACKKNLTQPQEPGTYTRGVLASRALIKLYGQAVDSSDSGFLDDITLKLSAAAAPIARAGKHPPSRLAVSIVRSKEFFAVSPGEGLVIISDSFISAVPSEASFAFVLAHELAHAILGNTGKDQELRADDLALQLIIAAGYDPRAAIIQLSSLFAHNVRGEAHALELQQRLLILQRKIAAYVRADSQGVNAGIISRRSFLAWKRGIGAREKD